MGDKNPNHPICNRPVLRLFCIIHVTSFNPPKLISTDTLLLLISLGCQTTELVPVKNSPPFSDVHYSPHISSFSSDFMLPRISGKVVFVPIELSVPEKLPSILNSPTAHSENISTRTSLIMVENQLVLLMGNILQQQEVDGFRHALHENGWGRNLKRSLDVALGQVFLQLHAVVMDWCLFFCWLTCFFCYSLDGQTGVV
jgi:hypothetical protein